MLIIFDEDSGLRIESFAIIKLRGVTTKFKIYFFTMQTFKELNIDYFGQGYHNSINCGPVMSRCLMRILTQP